MQKSPKKSYDKGNKDYTVSLTVYDNLGLFSTASQLVRINNRKPFAVISTNKTVTNNTIVGIAPFTVIFDSNSYDLDGTVVNYEWYLNGISGTPITTKSFTYTFTNFRFTPYVVTLRVQDDDGTWSSDMTPIMDPASSGTINNPTTTDKIVSMTRIPRDPLLRGWYGFYRESTLAEEDMESAFGYDDTKFMDYKETVDYFEKKLGLDKDAAIERAVQQGKKPNLQKRAPKDIKNKKNFIDRLILKEKDIDESENLGEDILIDKDANQNGELNDGTSNVNPILLRNINSLKKMAKSQGISTKELMNLFRNEF